MPPLPKAYNASEHEDAIYALWEKSGAFNPDTLGKRTRPFTISMPPPNATGTLHIGHCMMLVLQDLMIRYHRMIGDKTLWLPGTDHASIATQNKVEKLLAQEGITRHQLGREEFLERIKKYVEESRATIRNQIRKVGASCDWSRERYTLDAGLSKAVNEVFVRMYRDGLIYRGNRIVNWCPRCTSTLSDDEAKHQEEDAELTTIQYKIKNSPLTIPIATVRPETYPADVAIAVNPRDERYKEYIGLTATLPLTGREIPIIADEYVEKEFGTGALKITPAHDANDFAIAAKHHLKMIKFLDESGKITLVDLKKLGSDVSSLSSYEGLDRFEARKKIIEDLKNAGHILKTESYRHSVATCYRCGTVIEPYISLQWFVGVSTPIPQYGKSLKELTREAVQSGKIAIIPKRFEKIYFHWIDNLRDWCISRQIWFGHQLPVYYCKKENKGCGEIIVSALTPDTCPKCKTPDPVRDEDTLDTWFSSGLWTFSTLGWPDAIEESHGKKKKKGDLETFHPTSVLETGYDILFFWVARMIMMSEYALGEEPFRTVYLHGLVLDIEGKKMSKSKEETSINPLDVIPKFGADALRASMLIGVTPGNDLRLNEDKIASYRNFINKLWNISRYILEFSATEESTAKQHSLADTWIVSRLNATVARVSGHIEKYQFSQAAEELRSFTWDELADWYVEFAKIEGGKRTLLLSILRTVLALWHPFIPFVTESLYQHYREVASDTFDKKSLPPPTLIVHPWPAGNKKYEDKKAEEDFSIIKTIIQTIRNARIENGISASQKIQAIFFSAARAELLHAHQAHLKRLASLDFITVLERGDKPSNAVFLKVEDVEIYLPLGLMKIEEEKVRMEKEIEKITKQMEALRVRLFDQDFLAKAPKNIVKKEQERLAQFQSDIARLHEQLTKLE